MPDEVQSLLPPNATSLERGLETVTAESVARTEFDHRRLWNPDKCPEDLLAWLAWGFSVDDWSSDWPESKKRSVINTAIEVHRRKGTKGAIRRQLEAVDRPVEIVEWFEDHADWRVPFGFQVKVDVVDEGIDERHYYEIHRAVELNKNERSHYKLGVWLSNMSGCPKLSATCHSGETTTIYPWSVTQLSNQSRSNYGGGQYAADTTHVYPLS